MIYIIDVKKRLRSKIRNLLLSFLSKYPAKSKFTIIWNGKILLSKRFTHSPSINPFGHTKELTVIKTMITTELIRTICPKVSFRNLFSLAVIAYLSGCVSGVCAMPSKITANVRVFAKAGNSLIVQPGTNAQLKI